MRSLTLRPGDSLTILKMAVSMGFRVSVSLGPAIQATGPLVLAPGRVERWRAHGRVRWRIHGFRCGPQSGSPGDVSRALPKIPDGGFSPVRLQAEAPLINHALPAIRPR